MKRTAARRVSNILMLLALVATLASLVPVRSCPLELLTSFRVQITTLCFGTALLALGLRMRLWATIGIVLTAVQLGALFPIFVSAEKPAPARSSREYTVLTLNLEWTNRSDAEVVAAIRAARPDIVAIEEVDLWWRGRLDCLRDILPYQSFDPISTRPGVAVLSRMAPVSEDWLPLHGRPYATLEFERPGGGTFRFVAIHTLPPRSPLSHGPEQERGGVTIPVLRVHPSFLTLPLIDSFY